MLKKLVGLFAGTLIFASSAGASPGLPVVVGLKGEALVLIKAAEAGLPSMLFEGEKFYYAKAKIGAKIEKNSMIICNSDCRMKLVYPSGTSLFVAPGTVLRVVEAEDTPQGERSILNLIYGRLRSIVSKSHTQSWEIRTHSAVMGVRGTDFLTRHAPVEGTEVTVLGGKVDVKPTIETKTSIALSSHQSTHQEASGTFVTSPANKAQVLSAFETTLIPPPPATEEAPIQPLEDKSKIVALEELRVSQPEVYKTIKDPEKIGSTELNQKLVETPLHAAKSSGGTESFTHDLDIYKKYMGDGK